MRLLGVIVFGVMLLGVALYALLAVTEYINSSVADRTPAIGFGLLAMSIPLAVLIGIPAVFVAFFAAFWRRRK